VVSAVNAGGESPNSAAVSATPQQSSPPVAPTGLTAKATGKRKISLNWTQSTSPNVTQNKIYRSTTRGGPYAPPIATIPAATSYNNAAGLISGTTYYYVVTAVNNTTGQEGPFSNEASATAR
jgi:cellulose 1,4-beta-cellobiosidase